MSEELKKPVEWEKKFGLTIKDSDGWRKDGKSWDEPISKREFQERATNSTLLGVVKYLTPAEAAKRLHVSPKTISRWAREGKIPFIQTIGGHRRFNAEMIDQMAQETIKVTEYLCENPECPKAGHCGGECARGF